MERNIGSQNFYDPANPDATQRYRGLVNLAIALGFRDDTWFAQQLSQLNLLGKQGDKKLEGRVYEGLVQKAFVRDVRLSFFPFPEPRAPISSGNADILIGDSIHVRENKIQRGIPIQFPLERGMRMLIVGSSGCGKTRLLGSIFRDGALAYYPMIVIFELAKKEIHRLTRIFRDTGRTLATIGYRDILMNFFEVPAGVDDPKDWIVVTSQAFRDAYHEDFPEGAMRLLREVLNELYEERGIFHGNQDFPTLNEVVVRARKVSSAFAASRMALLNRLTDLRDSFPHLEHVKRGLPISKMEDSGATIHFELEGMDFRHQALIISYYSAGLMKRRVNQSEAMLKPALCVVEEGIDFVNKRLEHFGKRGHRSRALKIDWIFLSQEGFCINQTLINFCNVRILGTLPPEEASPIFSAWLLNENQSRWFIRNMQPRLFLIRAVEINQDPQVFLSRNVEIPDHLSDTDLGPGRRFLEDLRAHAVIEKARDRGKPDSITVPQPTMRPMALDKVEFQLLEHYARVWPALPITEYDKIVNIGRSTGYRIRGRLLANDLIQFYLIRAGGALKQFNIPVLTQKAINLLPPTASVQATSPSIGGGIAHSYKCDLIRFILCQQGYVVQKDKALQSEHQNGFVDLVASKPGGEDIALEIEESLKHGDIAVIENLKKCTAASFQRIYCVLPSAEICVKMKADLQPFLSKHHHVLLVTLNHFVKQVPDLWQKIVEMATTVRE